MPGPRGIDLTLPGITRVKDKEDAYKINLVNRLQQATTKQYFTANEARKLGIDISTSGLEDWIDWQVGIIPDETQENGYAISFISPSGIEKTAEEWATPSSYQLAEGLTREELRGSIELMSSLPAGAQGNLEIALQNIFPYADLSTPDLQGEAIRYWEYLAYQPTEEELTNALTVIFPGNKINLMDTSQALEELRGFAEEEPDAFIQQVAGQGWSKEGETIFRAMGLSSSDIEQIYGYGENMSQLTQLARDAFGENLSYPETLVKEWISNPQSLYDLLRKGDWSAEKEILLKTLYPELDDKKIRDIFYGEDTRSWFGKAWGNIAGGAVEMVHGLGGAMEWTGIPLIKELGQLTSESTRPDIVFKEMEWMKPAEGIGWSFMRQLPLQAVLMGASVITGGGAGGLLAGVGGKIGGAALSRLGMVGIGGARAAAQLSRLGPFMHHVLWSAGYAGASRSIESLLEAGSSYEQALNAGMSKEEASDVGWEVFKRNMPLVASDLPQFMIWLFPFSKQLTSIKSLVSKGLAGYVTKGLGIAGTTLIEGGEEYYQQIIQMQEMDEDVSAWAVTKNLSNEEIMEVTILGAMSGGMFGTAFTVIGDTTIQKLSKKVSAKVNKLIADDVRAGMNKTQAMIKALDSMINEDGVKEAIEQAIPEVEAQYYEQELAASQSRVKAIRETTTYAPRAEVQARAELGGEEQIVQPTAEATFTVTEPTEAVMESVATEEEVTEGEPNLKKTRQTIKAWQKMKGISDTQFKAIVRNALKARQAKGLTRMTEEELNTVLDAVKASRPKTIKGKKVITPKTERKIASLKKNLIREKKLTEQSFNRIVEDLNLTATGYISFLKFITESEGKSLIRAMNDEAMWMEHVIAIEEALAANPEIKEVYDKLTPSVELEGEPVKIGRGQELRSMRYYMQKLEQVTRAPLYQLWQMINMTHLAKRQYEKHLIDRLEKATGKAEYRKIVSNEESMKRVEDYIAAKHKASGIKSPTDITETEVAFAEEMEKQLFQFRNDVRYARFLNAYIEHDGNIALMLEEIPSANKQALGRAMDIYEGKGATALREFLDTQEWGVIRSGYAPLSVVKPKLYLYKTKQTVFGKGHIRTRTGIEYTQNDRNIMQRYYTYMRQLYGLIYIQPQVRTFTRIFEQNTGNIENVGHVGAIVSRDINIMKGYREEGGFFHWGAQRLYSQFAAATFWQLYMPVRNLFQNPALNPDTILTLNPKNKKLTNERRMWFEIFVAQDKGLVQDYLMRGVKPLPGLDRITRFANRTSLFPLSDKINRLWSFWLRINRADRALAGYAKDGNVQKLMKNSGANGLTPIQQRGALELLARDEVDYGIEGMKPVTGKEAFSLYVAQQHTNDVQFLYDRAQRAPAEQGPTGEIIGNILVFSRSWAERVVLQAGKLNPKANVSISERIDATRNITYMMAFGLMAGILFGKITGKDKYNPYNPLNILTWSPGGLMLGAAQDIAAIIKDITQAAMGDNVALGRLPRDFSGIDKLGLPFYKFAFQIIESGMGRENLDVELLRQLRDWIDEGYEVNGGDYEIDRNLSEILQHALFGATTPAETLAEKLAEAEAKLGKPVDDEDLIWSTEDPEIYDLSHFSSDIRNLIGDTPLEDILNGDYSPLVKAWVKMEQARLEYEKLPNKAIYKITNIYTDTSLTRRQFELLEEYTGKPEDEKEAFLELHPELKENPAEEWLLKSNPENNANLFLWGTTSKLLTEKAYNNVRSMMKELDIPDSLVKDLMPEKITPDYFDYQDILKDFSASSSEALLYRLEHPEFNDWAYDTTPDNNIEVLRINVKYREEDDIYDGFNTGDISYTELQSQEEAYLIENPEYAEARIRRNGYDSKIPEEWIDTYVAYVNSDYKGNKRVAWLKNHYDFYLAVKDLLSWQPLRYSSSYTLGGGGYGLPGIMMRR